MNCSSIDLKAYALGELAARDKGSVDDHVSACAGCREELERLNLTRAALMSLEEEEIPQRIAFVSDKVFEPRWWQSMWRSGPAMGFASAAMLACAILVHAFARPVAVPVAPMANAAQIEQRIDREVNARVDAAVAKAEAATEARHEQQIAQALEAAEKHYKTQRQADVAAVNQAMDYYERQFGRLLRASNNDERPGQ